MKVILDLIDEEVSSDGFGFLIYKSHGIALRAAPCGFWCLYTVVQRSSHDHLIYSYFPRILFHEP